MDGNPHQPNNHNNADNHHHQMHIDLEDYAEFIPDPMHLNGGGDGQNPTSIGGSAASAYHHSTATAFPSVQHHHNNNNNNNRHQQSSYGRNGGMNSTPAYAMVTQSGFQSSEVHCLLKYLIRAELVISLIFLVHGAVCPGYQNENKYQAICHTNIVSSLAGIITVGLGYASLCRFRSKGFMMAFMMMSIISSTAFLLIIVTSSVWLIRLSADELQSESSNMPMRILTLVLTLIGVAGGVCFIMTSIFICHRFAHKVMRYQVVGRLQSSRSQLDQDFGGGGGGHHADSSLSNSESDFPLIQSASSAGGPDQIEMQTRQYHICTSRCNH